MTQVKVKCIRKTSNFNPDVYKPILDLQQKVRDRIAHMHISHNASEPHQPQHDMTQVEVKCIRKTSNFNPGVYKPILDLQQQVRNKIAHMHISHNASEPHQPQYDMTQVEVKCIGKLSYFCPGVYKPILDFTAKGKK